VTLEVTEMTYNRYSETILLVDDDPHIHAVLQRALTVRGFTVLAAMNGTHAIQVADAHKAPIHLVISDVAMPDMSGPELFHSLRSWYPRMRFLFISGQIEGAEADISMDGRTAFLPKPFSIESLLNFIQHVLEVEQPAARS
jgi:two-component system cell cycle sensor histidine kinase/response regulator CckA